MDYTKLDALVHDEPLENLARAISNHADRNTLALLLDAELERRQRQFRLLKEYRDSLIIPIHALPPELLSHIFFLSACDDDYKALLSLSWTYILLVCRHWHDVAWSTPDLWSFVDLQRVPALPEGFDGGKALRRITRQRERVGASSMRVRMYTADSKYADDFFLPYQPFFWNPSSLASLHASGPVNKLSDLLTRMVAVDHPRLNDLAVLNEEQSAGKPLLSLDDGFLFKHTSLRGLHFAGVSFNIHLLHDLCSLNIAYLHDDAPTLETDEILDAVARCPALEFLRLKLQLRSPPPSANRSHGVDLPNLGSVQLEGSYATCTKLYSSLQLPPRTSVSVRSLDEIQPQDTSELLSYLKARCGHPEAPPITLLALNEMHWKTPGFDMSFCTRSQLTSSSKNFRTGGRKPATSCFVQVGFAASTPEMCADLATTTLRHFPLDNISHLDIRRMDECPTVLLNPFFELLPARSILAVSFAIEAFDELFDTLHLRLANRTRIPFNQIVLDAAEGLAQLGLPDIGWDPEECEDEIKETREQFSKALSYCSKAKEAGRPLDLLEVINDGYVWDLPPTVSFVLQVSLRRLWRDLAVGFVRNDKVLNRSGYWVQL